MNPHRPTILLLFPVSVFLFLPNFPEVVRSDRLLYGDPRENSSPVTSKKKTSGESGTRHSSGELENREAIQRERERALEREREQARKIRSLYERQRLEYMTSVERYREEQRLIREKAELERIRREDPDRYTFWQREQEEALGREIILTIPEDQRGFLFENLLPLQFQGWQALRDRGSPRLRGGVPLSSDQTDITNLLLSRKGNYAILILDPGGSRADIERGRYRTPTLEVGGEIYDCINIYSDGQDILRLEMEKRRADRNAGYYYIWTIRRLFIEYQ